jgi:ribosome-associated toxin RatA of RatAB toxin-antitoxin module
VPSARHEVDIEVVPSVLMSVISDFTRYPHFLPEIESCEVVRSADDEWDVAFEIKVVKRIRYTLRIRQPGPLQVRWELLDGPFKVNSGGWDLTPIADGKHTRALYFIEVQVGMFVPGSIMRSLVGRTLPETVQHFKNEAERVAATS